LRLFFFYNHSPPTAISPFPTRRSSDLATVFVMALQRGLQAYLHSFADPDTAAAVRLTLTTALVVVPINTLFGLAAAWAIAKFELDRKSTRLNSSHSQISYAVFCLKKKN